MNLREAAQQALEAWFQPHGINYVDFRPYMEALRTALAEPEQEPMAYVSGSYAGHFTVVPTNPALVLTTGMALYTHPVDDTALLRQALSTLEGWANYGKWVWPESALEQAKRNTEEAIAALRERLEGKA